VMPTFDEFELYGLVQDVYDDAAALAKRGLNADLPHLLPPMIVMAAAEAERGKRGAGLRAIGSWPRVLVIDASWGADHWVALDRILPSPALGRATNPVGYLRAAVNGRVREMELGREKTERLRRRRLMRQRTLVAHLYGSRRIGDVRRALPDAADHVFMVSEVERTCARGLAIEPPRDLVGFALDAAAPRILRQALDSLRARGLPPDQAEYVRLREAGFSATEALRRVGKGLSPHVALHQKLRRRLAGLAS